MNVDRERLNATKGKGERKNTHALLHTSTTLTSLLIRANVTANQTTLLSCVFGLLGVLALWAGFKFLSILLFYFHWTLDYSDGWIARYTGTASDFGAMVDDTNHAIVTVFLFIVVASLIGQFLLVFVTVSVYLLATFRHCHDINLLGGFYNKVTKLISPILLLEFSLYFSIILDRWEVVTVAYLLVWGAMCVLSVITKIIQWRKVMKCCSR